ncbi:hypothetical protein HHK36_022365 [Tetracentron sinense]|uniref:Uncharacterized protein n=1 Tax=Tetracentron sinense TaxID=13715 RepID=A0A834YRU0_TETSI|nr:hypothetical protein HHK36_022365 [Tetracentron sinense]
MEEAQEELTSPSAIEADDAWDRFMELDNDDIISRMDSQEDFFSRKDLYSPTLMDEGTMSFALDKRSEKKCYMLGARRLSITDKYDPQKWTWIDYLPEFWEVAELVNVPKLKIHGKMETRLLSLKTTYAAYLVYKFTEGTLRFRPVKLSIKFEGDGEKVRRNVNLKTEDSLRFRWLQPVCTRLQQEKKQPGKREDGWLEIEMGEFFNEGGKEEDGEVEMGLEGMEENKPKSGLIIQGIELRPKETSMVDSKKDGESDRKEMEGSRVDLAILPKPKGWYNLSLITSRHAPKQQTPSSTFRSTLESDAVWERILPLDYKDIISRSGSQMALSSNIDIYNYLCRGPIVIDKGKMSVALDKRSGKKSYMFGARQLSITWGNDPRFWKWPSLPNDSRFSKVAQLLGPWLEIYGKMETRILSPKTHYAAYLVFKFIERTRQPDDQPSEVYLKFNGDHVGQGLHTVYLDPDGSLMKSHRESDERDVKIWMKWERELPQERGDGWMEIEMGEFFNDQGEEGDLDMGLNGREGCCWKSGLAIEGIELRPKDSSRVSTIYRSNEEKSEEFWEKLLPSDYKEIISKSVHPVDSSSKKDLYFRLCSSFILLEQGKMSFELEKRSGKKCFMVAAKELSITWGNDTRYWKWTHLPEFSEVAQLVDVCWLEIKGKMETRILSPDTTYAACLVFKLLRGARGFEVPVEAYLKYVKGGVEKSKNVFLDPDGGLRREHQNSREMNMQNWLKQERELPRARGDGWLEIEMGEPFKNQGEGEVEIRLQGTEGLNWKSGLIIQGFELRPKEYANN